MNLKTRPVAALAATAAILGVTMGTAHAAPKGTRAVHCDKVAGSTVTLTTDVGLSEKFVYSADGTQLTATVLQPGPFPLSVGFTATESMSTALVGPDTWMVSWVEASGLTVSEVENFWTGAVQIFWTYDAGDGTRVAEQHTGTVVCNAQG